MTPRERILAACNHQTPDKLPVDFGGCFQTGIHASMVYRLRQSLGLDSPDTPVKVVEVYQMLGEIKDDLRDVLGIDTVSLAGTGTMFGYPAKDFKQWRFHDGTPLLDCIVEAEFDILNPVQCTAAGMEPKRLKRKYGDRLVFWGGGVDTQTVLSFGTPQQVRDQVRDRVDVFAPGGGFVFSTIHNVTPSTPIKNLLAMFDALRRHR